MPATLRHSVVSCAMIALLITAGCASAPGQPSPTSAPESAVAATPEEQIGALLGRLADDMSHRRLPRVLNVVSNAYKDDAGRDFNGVKQYLSDTFRDYRDVHITRTPPKITVQGEEARSVETLGIVGEPDSAKVPPFSFQGNVAITLRHVDRTWLIIKVQLLH